MAIVFKIVYSNFESVGSEFLPQFGWNPVASFGDKIKGRAESQFYLQSASSDRHFARPAPLSTSCVRTKANFLPSGQPGQFSGGRSDPGMIGHTSPMRLRAA